MLALVLALVGVLGDPVDAERGDGFASLPRSLAGRPEETFPQFPSALFTATDPEDSLDPDQAGSDVQPSDLTLLNFFSEGWGQPWVRRRRKTPDMALLRVTTNFMQRLFRVDWAETRHINGNPNADRTDLFSGFIAYAIDRRIMVEVIANYQWNHQDGASVVDGPGAAALVRFQLVDTEESSMAAQMRVSAPNRSIGQTATTLSPALAGWHDLDAILGLPQVGVYYSVTWDNLSGPHADNIRTNSVGYDLSLAKTWTDPSTPLVSNFTTFLELFAMTDLDGPSAYHTAVSLTPGIQFWFAPQHSLIAGVDFPVSRPHPYSEVFRIGYMLHF